MGAHGSTAASCSSLDISERVGGQSRARAYQQRHYDGQYRNLQHSHHEEKMLKYRKQQLGAKTQAESKLKHAKSYFDLLERPAMVSPSQPVPALIHAKKSNAGVASKILHHRQQQNQQQQRLKKFSDSLPSLNNIVLSPPPQLSPLLMDGGGVGGIHYQCQSSSNTNLISHYVGSSGHQQYSQQLHSAKPYASHQQMITQGERANHPSPQPAKLVQSPVTSSHLELANGDERFRADHRHSQHLFHRRDHEFGHQLKQPACPLQPPRLMASANGHQHQQQRQHFMKRATSLSSLHNLHNQHDIDGGSYNSNELSHVSRAKKLSRSNMAARVAQHQQHRLSQSNATTQQQFFITDGRPESMNSNSNYYYDVNRQYAHGVNHLPSTPMGNKTKSHKFKPAIANGQVQPSRYKSKSNKNHQQHQTQQQGCPVLPPLPRSQSLHELIQLRATENGQRMRTTGTLRGPLGGPESCNKVNLVAELLETRRQQKLSEDSQQREISSEGHRNVDSGESEVILSQCSSSDDGIHDVSLTGEHPSVGDDHSTATGSSTGAAGQNVNKQAQKLAAANCLQGRRGLFTGRQQQPVPSSGDKEHFSQSKVLTYGESPSARLDCAADIKSDEKNHIFQKVEGKSKRNAHQKSSHKSTLKRSLSHSALHQSQAGPSDSDRGEFGYDRKHDDGDESDDLNELAKFLHQFKQRQAKNRQQQAQTQKQQAQVGSEQTAFDGQNLKLTNIANGDRSHGSANLARSHQQQSPSSTTSSSGFASSTCTSNSISSTRSEECNNKKLVNGNGSSKPISRKKYPAPPRPDENLPGHAADPSNNKRRLEPAFQNNANSKCMISGKLKLSSSLLSIVDEYNNSSSSNSNSILATVSRTGACDTNERAAPGARGSSFAPTQNDHDLVKAEPDNLDHLKRYTRLRQLSQSALALNHLTSSTKSTYDFEASGRQSKMHDGKDKLPSHGGAISKQPYKNRLINLIRRISDKSADQLEALGGSQGDRRVQSAGITKNKVQKSINGSNSVGGQHQDAKYRVASGKSNSQTMSESPKFSPGSHQNFNAIYQSQTTAANSNQTNSRSSSLMSENFHQAEGALMTEIRNEEPLRTTGTSAYLDNKSHADSKAKLMPSSCLSESLCDLNFDCDLELIKNCSGAGRATASAASEIEVASKQKAASSRQQTGSSPAHHLAMPKPAATGDANQSRQVVAGQHRNQLESHQNCNKNLKDSGKISTGRQANPTTNLPAIEKANWRLASTPLSLVVKPGNSSLSSSTSMSTAATTSCIGARSSACCCSGRADCCSRQNHKSKDGKCKPVLQRAGETSEKSTSSAGASKLRWPASGWLMNSGAKKRAAQQHANGKESSNEGPASKSRLARLISSSGTLAPAAETAGKSGSGVSVMVGCSNSERHKLTSGSAAMVTNEANNINNDKDSASADQQLTNEADQLLVELDHSLDLVSGRQRSNLHRKAEPFSRRAAVSWWKSTGGNNACSQLDHGRGQMDGDFPVIDEAYDAMSRIKLQRLLDADGFAAASGTLLDSDDDDDSHYDGDHNHQDAAKRRRIRHSTRAAEHLGENHGDHPGDDDDDEDDEDEGDYASLNRAMINEIFDVEYARGVKLTNGAIDSAADRLPEKVSSDDAPVVSSSPSHSFTFSAPNSPEPSVTTSVAAAAVPVNFNAQLQPKARIDTDERQEHQHQADELSKVHLSIWHDRQQQAQEARLNKGSCLQMGRFKCAPSAISNSSSSAVGELRGKTNSAHPAKSRAATTSESDSKTHEMLESVAVKSSGGTDSRAEIVGEPSKDNSSGNKAKASNQTDACCVPTGCIGSANNSARLMEGGNGFRSSGQLQDERLARVGRGTQVLAGQLGVLASVSLGGSHGGMSNNLDKGNNKRGAGGSDHDKDAACDRVDDDIATNCCACRCCLAEQYRPTNQHQCQLHRRQQPKDIKRKRTAAEADARIDGCECSRVSVARAPSTTQDAKRNGNSPRGSCCAALHEGRGDTPHQAKDLRGQPKPTELSPSSGVNGCCGGGNNHSIVCHGADTASCISAGCCVGGPEPKRNTHLVGNNPAQSRQQVNSQICMPSGCNNGNRTSEDNCGRSHSDGVAASCRLLSGKCCPADSSGTNGTPSGCLAHCCRALERQGDEFPVPSVGDSLDNNVRIRREKDTIACKGCQVRRSEDDADDKTNNLVAQPTCYQQPDLTETRPTNHHQHHHDRISGLSCAGCADSGRSKRVNGLPASAKRTGHLSAATSNPICRSNSELTASCVDNLVAVRSVESASIKQDGQLKLSGKLRSSLLSPSSKSGLDRAPQKFGSSQFGFAQVGGRQYNDATFIVKSDASLAAADNFILRRKTPNAGLRSQC